MCMISWSHPVVHGRYCVQEQFLLCERDKGHHNQLHNYQLFQHHSICPHRQTEITQIRRSPPPTSQLDQPNQHHTIRLHHQTKVTQIRRIPQPPPQLDQPIQHQQFARINKQKITQHTRIQSTPWTWKKRVRIVNPVWNWTLWLSVHTGVSLC
jgi:hypothetical protein